MGKNEKVVDDSQQQLLALLTNLSGHLEAVSPKDERSIQSLQETLTRVLPGEDIAAVRSSFFSIEKSNPFSADTIPLQQWKCLQDFAARVVREPCDYCSRLR